MKKWYMVIDVGKCEDCNNCLLACKDEHVANRFPGYSLPQPKHGQRWINIERKERGQFPQVDVAYLPVPCMHCQDPACCREARQGGAYRRGDGIVLIDPQKAKNQRQIVEACPYGAIFWNEEEKVPQKCTFCAHLLDEGWSQPRCVAVCPTGALSSFKLEESEMRHLVEEEELEFHQEGPAVGHQVYYKNLYRFTKCFVAGSVAVDKGGLVECLEGARIVLTGSSAIGSLVGETVSDAFGDFRIDGLDPHAGSCCLAVSHSEFGEKTLEVQVTESLSLGTILLG